jgi:uncharacterized protein DUF4382
MQLRSSLHHAVLLGLSLALLASCNHSSSPSVSGGMGRLEINMTDAPIDLSTVASVVVTISDVLVYPGTEGMSEDSAPPIVLSTHPQTFDLLTLTGGATDLLASGEVPAGFYQRIRLEISSANLTYKDGTMSNLKIDSNKVDIPIGFQLAVNADKTIVLDFDAGASVQVNETGSSMLILRPVVTPKML